MARLKIPRKNSINIVFDKYLPMNEPQTLNEVLSQFEGEVDNAITRQRIEFALENWYMRTGEYVRFDDLTFN
jgi:hypothetical protein